jgi:hypothetical protein
MLMKKIIILLSIVASACNPLPKTQEEVLHHDLLIKSDRFKITFIKSEDKQFVLTPISYNKKMELVKSETDTQLQIGYTDEEEQKWRLEGLPSSMPVSSVSVMPYYSYGAYAFLSRAKEYEKIYPDCPVTTKKLIIFHVGPQSYPIAGCIH